MVEQLEREVRTFAKKVDDEEDKYLKIPEYVKMRKIEERIKQKAGMVEQLEREVGLMAGEKEMWMREAKEDREAWSVFRAACVNLADALGGGLVLPPLGGEEGRGVEGGLQTQRNRFGAERAQPGEQHYLRRIF